MAMISYRSADDEMIRAITQETIKEIKVVEGIFIADAHPTSIECSVNGTTLSLTNFKTDTGPKLLLYLTPEAVSED